MTDHEHADYETPSNVSCQKCGKVVYVCAYCNEDLHKCEAVDKRLLPGYRVVPGFPDFMVNKQAAVRHIKTRNYCGLIRVTKGEEGGAMINVVKDGKTYTRAAQVLRDLAFPDVEG